VRFSYGSTRFVLLTEHAAYKLARIRVLIFLGRLLFVLPFSRQGREHFLLKYGPGWIRALATDLFAGIFANYREFKYWEECRDERVIPTLKLLLGGLIVVQPRGLPLPVSLRSESGKSAIVPWDLMHVEMRKDCQFAIDPETGRVVLIDYGNATIVKRLRESYVEPTDRRAVLAVV
jgi:hypothetical protein